MREKAFIALGAVLILLSLFFSYVELGRALQGSAGAWIVLSALVCAGVLGAGMVRVGRGLGTNPIETKNRAVQP